MALVSSKETLTVLASFTDIIPFLTPIKTTILLLADAVEQVSDNRNQCIYILRRCAGLCLQIHKLHSAKTVPVVKRHAQAVEEFKRTLDKILICVKHLSLATPLRRFLQRHEISESIIESHRHLDACVELFNLQSASNLIFVVAEHEAARQLDQAQLSKTLEQLLKNDANILEALELRGDQLLEAVRGLRDTVTRGVEDAIQQQFAMKSLKTLQNNYRSSAQISSYGWAVSSLEILVEGEVLGSGAFGTVYVGRWNGTRVAVKQLAKGTPREMLIHEIDIWRRLQHPHIASFFRACIESNPPLLVSELYIFGNAVNYLFKFPQANRVNMCHEISLGMVFLHGQKIVHGDLKPANVLIDDAHRARITDFGLSKVKSSVTTQTANDQPESTQARLKAQGTRAFMAPERLRRGTMGFSVDVYAFAMSAYQIMTGDAPFQHLPEDDIRQVVVVDHERPERPEDLEIIARGLTDEMWGLMESCWADERQKRPSFQDVVATLEVLKASYATLSSVTQLDISSLPVLPCPVKQLLLELEPPEARDTPPSQRPVLDHNHSKSRDIDLSGAEATISTARPHSANRTHPDKPKGPVTKLARRLPLPPLPLQQQTILIPDASNASPRSMESSLSSTSEQHSSETDTQTTAPTSAELQDDKLPGPPLPPPLLPPLARRRPPLKPATIPESSLPSTSQTELRRAKSESHKAEFKISVDSAEPLPISDSSPKSSFMVHPLYHSRAIKEKSLNGHESRNDAEPDIFLKTPASPPLSRSRRSLKRLRRFLGESPQKPEIVSGPGEKFDQYLQALTVRCGEEICRRGMEQELLRVKAVVVGDEDCGKTFLLHALICGYASDNYVWPISNYTTRVNVADYRIFLGVFTTTGQEHYDRLRPLTYAEADVCLACFDIGSPESLVNVQSKWVGDVRHHTAQVPIILVGCKKDLRSNEELRMGKKRLVTKSEAEDVATAIRAVCYIECSALTGDVVQDVFKASAIYGFGRTLREGGDDDANEKEVADGGCVIV